MGFFLANPWRRTSKEQSSNTNVTRIASIPIASARKPADFHPSHSPWASEVRSRIDPGWSRLPNRHVLVNTSSAAGLTGSAKLPGSANMGPNGRYFGAGEFVFQRPRGNVLTDDRHACNHTISMF